MALGKLFEPSPDILAEGMIGIIDATSADGPNREIVEALMRWAEKKKA